MPNDRLEYTSQDSGCAQLASIINRIYMLDSLLPALDGFLMERDSRRTKHTVYTVFHSVLLNA